MRLRIALGLGLVISAAAIGAACSATDGSELSSEGSGANNSGAGAATGAGGGFIGSASGGSTASGFGGGCASSTVKADELPLDMYIMLDQSGSMSDSVQGGNKWSAVTTAFTDFVSQPSTTGIGVGLQYFPLTSGPACPPTCQSDAQCGACGPCFLVPPLPGFCLNAGGDSCNIAEYAQPEVPISPLPGVANAIISSFAAHGPSGGTPTSAALQGALDYTTSWANNNPQHVVIVVLATDGDPTSCDTNLSNIAAIASAGANGTPQILTFVIGVGNSLTNLNGIAAAGGTNQAFIVDTNANVTQQFLDALNVIKGQALGCTYAIPDPDMGDPDYNAVNVQYTPGDGSPAQTIPKVSSAAACGAGEGWYYNDNQNPTQIILCDASCTKVAADDMGQVDIVLGCATVAK